MPFAQLIIGPPGSGKSTYCDGMQQFMTAIGRKCSIVNLDPANDHTAYSPALDIRDLVKLDEIMEAEELGPNGGVLYAVEELEHNMEWLQEGLASLGEDYILFDCPGQVELFTHHNSLRNIFIRLQKFGYRLVALQLTDSLALTQPTHYISVLLLALRSMLQLDLPHLNVITKIDNLASYQPLPLPLSFYTESRSLEHILPHLEAEQTRRPPAKLSSDVGRASHPDQASNKFTALNKAIIELIEEFGLVGFETLAVEDRKSMATLLHAIDRAGGYAFGGVKGANETIWDVAVREGGGGTMSVRDVEERWIDRREEFDEAERKEWEQEAREANARNKAQENVKFTSTGPGEVASSDNGNHGSDSERLSVNESGIRVIRKKAG